MSQIELFDYSALAPDLQVEVKSATERIKLRMKRTAEDIIEIGKDLIAIKEKLPHGQFLPWIASEFEMSSDTAQNFMNVASRFPQIPNYSDFKPTILYLLAAPSTPDEVVEQVIEKSENGETVTAKELKELKAQYRAKERELIEKDAAIAQLKEANKFATTQLQEQKELVKTTNEMMLSEAEKIAQKKVELEVKKATQPLQSQVAELNSKITQLEGEKTKAKTELETAKKAYDEGLAKFKANPDPETKKTIENLRLEYEKTKAEVNRVTFALDNLKTKENQAFSATLSIERFFGKIQKVISEHPDAMIAMSSPYLDERFLAKIESFADAFAEWSNSIRLSVQMTRENQSKSVESVEVEVLDNDAELPLLEATPIDYFPEVEDEEEF